MKKILITGATGDLGRELALYLKKQNYEVFALVRKTSRVDILKSEKIAFFESLDSVPLPIDAIVDCATNYGRNKESFEEIRQTNFFRAKDLLHWAIQNKVPRFIWSDTLLPDSMSDYARSKAEFRNYLKTVNDIEIPNLRMEHFYGAIEAPHKFLPWFVLEMLQEKGPLKLTKGEQKRNFVHFSDVLRAYEILLKSPLKKGYQEFQVGCFESWELKEVLLYIQAKLGKTHVPLQFGALPYRENELMGSNCDLSALKKLGWNAEIGVKQGLDMLTKVYLTYWKEKGN